MHQVEMTDQDLRHWLLTRGWSGHFFLCYNTAVFTDPAGRTMAHVIYTDMVNRKVFIKEE